MAADHVKEMADATWRFRHDTDVTCPKLKSIIDFTGGSISRAVSGVSSHASGALKKENKKEILTRTSKKLETLVCDECKDPVAYSYGTPEALIGVSQGCFPCGSQMKEGSTPVDYWSNGQPLPESCQRYFSLLQHSEVSVEMVEALKKDGMLTDAGDLPEPEEEMTYWDNKIQVAGQTPAPGKKSCRRVHPWPISGAPRLPTYSARVKGMASGSNIFTTFVYGSGMEDKRLNSSQYIPHPSHITQEEPRLDDYGYPIITPTTSSFIDQLQSTGRDKYSKISDFSQVINGPPERLAVSSEGTNFRTSVYGAVLTRRPLASQLSARRISHSVSAPASVSPRRRMANGSDNRIIGEEATVRPKSFGVVFDDGTTPRFNLAGTTFDIKNEFATTMSE